MLDILKSKMMISVAIMLLGTIFINAGSIEKLEESRETTEVVIAENLK